MSRTAVMLAFLWMGCAEVPPPEDNTVEVADTITTAAAVARAIAANPDGADGILNDHGFTVDQFDALMYEIAEDPEKTAAFEKARAGG